MPELNGQCDCGRTLQCIYELLVNTIVENKYAGQFKVTARTQFTATAVSQLLLARNPLRASCIIRNLSSNDVALRFGNQPLTTVGAAELILAAGDIIIFGKRTDIPYIDEVQCIAGANSILGITEINEDVDRHV